MWLASEGALMNSVLTLLAVVGLVLGSLYVLVTLLNLAIFRSPPRAKGRPGHSVSILIPARDEAGNIGPALKAALSQDDAEVEVVVLDDGSTDGTSGIVSRAAAADPRVRLIRGAALPKGWNGKQHACHQLAAAASHPVLLFVDADVRLAPDCVERMLGYLERRSLDLVSGFPRQITRTLGERIVIPQILVLLLGYLPLPMARIAKSDARFAAGCGQLMMVRAEAYRAAGGHAAFRDRMHDGLNLPRNVRRAGGRTDILDATPLAHVRMYDNWADIWAGFTKNATEGMATPRGLPIWTVLLAGGHLLPPLVALMALAAGAGFAAAIAGLTTAAVLIARSALAVKARQSPLVVLLHLVGVAVTLWIQWSALRAGRRGQRAIWRGRAYDVH